MITVSILQMGKLEHKRRKVLPKIRPSKLSTKRSSTAVPALAPTSRKPSLLLWCDWNSYSQHRCSLKTNGGGENTLFKFSKKLHQLQSISTIRLHTTQLQLRAECKQVSHRENPKQSLLFVRLPFGVTHKMA